MLKAETKFICSNIITGKRIKKDYFYINLANPLKSIFNSTLQ